MVDIEPYQYQKTTNVKEHNDIVAKINEIVDVLNNSGTDTLGPRVSKLETDVSALDSAVKIQYQDIASIKDKDQAQDNNIGTLDAQVKGITDSLISDVNIIDGTTTGKFKVRLDREKAPSIDSNDYDLQKATSIELIQGSGPSMLKAQITLSDGTTLISDDFLFTTEAIGTDVYISSFVFKNGNVAGTISADIGLSNGSTLEANNFTVPMDPSLLNTVQDLSTRLTAVEGGSVAGFKELEAQVNTNKNNITTLTTEIDDLDIKKADQSNSNQEIVAGTITATNITKGGVNVATVNDIPDISGKVNIAQGTENAGKILVVSDDGNVTVGDAVSKIPYENLGYILPTFDVITDSVIKPTLFSSSTNLYLIDPLKMYLYNDSIVLAGWTEAPSGFKDNLSIGYSTDNYYLYIPEEMRTALIGKKFRPAGNTKIYYMARYGTIKICFRANITTDSNKIITAVDGDGLIASNSVISIPQGTKLHFTPVCATNNITYAYSYDNPVPDDYIALTNFI